MRRIWTVCVALMLTFAVGCGGSEEKDKYKDMDQPQPAAEGEE